MIIVLTWCMNVLQAYFVVHAPCRKGGLGSLKQNGYRSKPGEQKGRCVSPSLLLYLNNCNSPCADDFCYISDLVPSYSVVCPEI